jgi:hypothetical protein
VETFAAPTPCSRPARNSSAVQFLRGHIERIFFDHGKVVIVGNVAVPTQEEKLQFRIEGEIDSASAHSKSLRGLWRDERSTSWMPGAAPMRQ